MRKLPVIAHSLGLTLYNHYLKRMSENLITPQLIHGILYREGLQYFLLTAFGQRYAVRMIDVHGAGINKSDVGKSFEAETINDPGVIVPEGFVAWVCKLQLVQPKTPESD